MPAGAAELSVNVDQVVAAVVSPRPWTSVCWLKRANLWESLQLGCFNNTIFLPGYKCFIRGQQQERSLRNNSALLESPAAGGTLLWGPCQASPSTQLPVSHHRASAGGQPIGVGRSQAVLFSLSSFSLSDRHSSHFEAGCMTYAAPRVKSSVKRNSARGSRWASRSLVSPRSSVMRTRDEKLVKSCSTSPEQCCGIRKKVSNGHCFNSKRD